MIDHAIADINAALAVVASEAKQFIYDCGAAVALATGEELLGLSDNKVSAAEVAALVKFKVTLEI